MAPIIEGPPDEGDERPAPRQKLVAFAAIWLGSLTVVAAVSYALRGLLLGAGD